MTQSSSINKKDLWIEVFNSITHGIAAVLGVVGLILLVQKAISNPSSAIEEILSYIVYGSSFIILFLSSTLYHSFSFTRFKDLFQKIDHASIYLLIAGSYTPYLMLTVGGTYGSAFLLIVWIAAIAGIVFEVVWTNRFPKLSTYLYLLMGWMGIFLIYPLYRNLDMMGITLLILGGISYSAGTVFYRMKHNGWMHVIWHLFVVIGAMSMFFSIYLYV